MNKTNPFFKLLICCLAGFIIQAAALNRLEAQPTAPGTVPDELEPGQMLLNAGQYEATLKWIEAYTANGLENHTVPVQATLFTLQANAQRHLGYLQQAIELHQKALEMREIYFGYPSIEVSNSCQNIGNCWLAQNKLEEALSYLIRARKIREKLLVPPDDALASIYNSLAEVYRQKGYYSVATKLLNTAIHYRQELHGEQHATIAPLLLGLSNVFLDQDMPEAAQQVLESLLYRLKDIPEMQIARASNNMGYCQLALGEPEKALYFHEQAVALSEKGKEDLSVFASCLAGLGQCYLSLGEPSEAEPILRRAIAYYRSYPQENVFKIAETYNDLGLCYRSRGQLPQAISYHEQAISLYLNGSRDKHPNLAGFFDNLGKCLTRQGSYESARYYFQKALGFPPSGLYASNNKVRSLLHIGNTFLKEQKPTQAQALFEHSLQEYEKHSLNDFILLQLIHYCIGNALASSGQGKLALLHYDKAMAAIEAKQGRNLSSNTFYNYEKAQILAAKGHVLQKTGLTNHDQRILLRALESYRKAVSLTKGIQPHFKHETSGLYLQADFASLYHGLIELCYYFSEEKEPYLPMAFHYSEDYKAVQLRRALWRNRSKSYAGVPDSLVAKEKKIETAVLLSSATM